MKGFSLVFILSHEHDIEKYFIKYYYNYSHIIIIWFTFGSMMK